MYLGREDEHMVFKAEVVGLMLVAVLVRARVTWMWWRSGLTIRWLCR